MEKWNVKYSIRKECVFNVYSMSSNSRFKRALHISTAFEKMKIKWGSEELNQLITEIY